MQALIQALIGRMIADAELNTIFGAVPAVYLTEAPESAALPLMVLRVAAGRCAHDFSGDRITVVKMTIQVIAADLNVALSAAERVGVLLDNAAFALSAGSLLGCRRTAPIAPAMPGFNFAQIALYRACVNVECQVFDAP